MSCGAALADESLISKDLAAVSSTFGRACDAAETRRVATQLGLSPRAQSLPKQSMGAVPDDRRLAQGRKAGLTHLQTAALVSRTGFGSAATNRASRSDDANSSVTGPRCSARCAAW